MSKSQAFTQEEIDSIMEEFEALIEVAIELQKSGNYKASLDKYDEAIVFCNRLGGYEVAMVYVNRGIALDHLDRCEDAVASFDQAIELDPEDGVPYNGRGNALKHLGEKETNPDKARKYYEDAIASYDLAIEYEPNDAGYICNKARTLQLLGRDAEALDCLNQAHRVLTIHGFDSTFSQQDIASVESSLAQRGELLQKIIKLQEAALEAEQLITKCDPNDPRTQEAVEEFAALKQDARVVMDAYSANYDSKNFARESVHQMQAADGLLQKIAMLEQRLDQYGSDIIDIKVKIDSLELSQQQLSSMVVKLKSQGIKDTDKVLGFLSDLKSSITGVMPDHIAHDPYKIGFWNAFQRDLNATYVAALSVQTDIVANSKKGEVLGKMGSILSTAGEYIPTIGGGVVLLGAILNFIDQKQQDVAVKRFAELANSTRQMEAITLQVTKFLAQDHFMDMLNGGEAAFNGRVTEYLMSFVQGISGRTTKHKKAADSAIDVMCKMGVSDEASLVVVTPKAKTSIFSKIPFGKKKAAASDVEQEEVKISHSSEKSQGEKIAHMLSAIIVSKIFRGEIPVDGTPEDMAKSIACSVFGHFQLDAGLVEELLTPDVVQTHMPLGAESSVSDTAAETLEAKITEDILARIARRESVTDEFAAVFTEAMSSRLKTAKSSADVKFISSLRSSADFAEMFKAHTAEIFAMKLKADAAFSPSLRDVKFVLQEVETELRDEDGFVRNDGQILVWNARIEYDNPFLNHPELLQLARDLGINPVRLINVGKESPELTKGIFNGIETYGAEFVLSAVFGGNCGGDVSSTLNVIPEEVSVTGDTAE